MKKVLKSGLIRADFSEVYMTAVREARERVHAKLSDNIGVLIIDNPKHNILSFDVLQELKEKFDWVSCEPNAKAIVFTAKPGFHIFSTGANAKEIARLSLSQDKEKGERVLTDLHKFFRAIERCPKPTIAAVEGLCLGGGFELALSCAHRVASPHARFGLPEIELGIIPGLGGTQRLSRIASPQFTLRTVLRGSRKFLTAAEAKEASVVEAVIEGDFITGVKAFVEKALSGDLPYTRIISYGGLKIDDFVKDDEFMKLKEGRPNAAVNAAVKAINEGVNMQMPDALRLEQEIFLKLLFDKETRARFRKEALKKMFASAKKRVGAVMKKFCVWKKRR